MRFMKDNEFLLLMVHNPPRGRGDVNGERWYTLTLEDRCRLFDVGIRTASEQPSWREVEPEKGEYNFDYMDDIVHMNREAGLKTSFGVPFTILPDWIPNEWKGLGKDGIYIDANEHMSVLSFWNNEAQEYLDNYIRLLLDRYSEEDIAFRFEEYQGGEGAYPPAPSFYDPPALEDYKRIYGSFAVPELTDPDTLDWFGKKIIEHFVRLSKILYPKHKEVWNDMQYLMDTDGPHGTKAFGNFVQTDILREYRRLWPDDSIVLLQYTYYDEAHKHDNVLYVDMLREEIRCEVIVEAMYCKGLAITTPKAIAQGFRGQVVWACNALDQTALQDWEVNAIRDSHNLWKEAYEDNNNSQDS